MKTIQHCPKCGDPMLNEGCGVVKYSGPERWRLSCDKRLDHDILALTVVGDDSLLAKLYIAVRMGTSKINRIHANWDFEEEKLEISKGRRGHSFYPTNTIPYFQPDLTQYNKLIKKLKTYIIFG